MLKLSPESEAAFREASGEGLRNVAFSASKLNLFYQSHVSLVDSTKWIPNFSIAMYLVLNEFQMTFPSFL